MQWEKRLKEEVKKRRGQANFTLQLFFSLHFFVSLCGKNKNLYVLSGLCGEYRDRQNFISRRTNQGN